MSQKHLHSFFNFFFNDAATTEIYTLSLHDALPISGSGSWRSSLPRRFSAYERIASVTSTPRPLDRKSTRLNSSHEWISYAVFCLKKKKKTRGEIMMQKQINMKTRDI